MSNEEICYLCGKVIVDDASVDHVPPKQFYSREIRKSNNPNLFTLLAHGKCNHDYQKDEEYFIHSICPLVLESYAGQSLFRELNKQYGGDRNLPLGRKVFAEFDKHSSGLILPNGKVVKRFDPKRVWRVVWKIIRGLYFREYGEVLPDDTPRFFELVNPGEEPPPVFCCLSDDTSGGDYPDVFDYKFCKFDEANGMHFWAVLFWNKLITLIWFHDPSCDCEVCSNT